MAKSMAVRLRERLRSWRRRRAGVPPRPEWVQVEINNTCNLKCVMCPRSSLGRSPRHMTLTEFKDIADKCQAAGVPRLRLFFMGEPLLHPDLLDMIAYAKQIGISDVEFNTNAALLSEDKARAILASGLDEIVFSLDGADKETYEAVRVGAEWETVSANVERFCRLRKESGQAKPRTRVQTMVMERTRGQIPAFRARWESLADEVAVQCVREYHGLEGLRTTQVLPGDELRPCPAPWTYLVILADLRVVPCCEDISGQMTLGNVADTDILTLWREAPRLQALRERQLQYDYRGFPRCAECEVPNLSLVQRKAAAAAAESGPRTSP